MRRVLKNLKPLISQCRNFLRNLIAYSSMTLFDHIIQNCHILKNARLYVLRNLLLLVFSVFKLFRKKHQFEGFNYYFNVINLQNSISSINLFNASDTVQRSLTSSQTGCCTWKARTDQRKRGKTFQIGRWQVLIHNGWNLLKSLVLASHNMSVPPHLPARS